MSAAPIDELLAHSRNPSGVQQALEEHLHKVADLAGAFASEFNEERAGRVAGLLHDLGKAKQSWQERLRALEAGVKPKWNEVQHDHKMTSAAYAWDRGFRDIAQIIAGHHGGMLDHGDFQNAMLAGMYTEGMREGELDSYSSESSLQFYRLLMIFSCLVDADSIDTGAHFHERLTASTLCLAELNTRLLSQALPTSSVSEQVLRLRENVRQACLAAVTAKKGFFSLSAATGSGKTISGALFAVGHAAHHRMARVVYVAPYRSIIDQTAAVYKSVFSDESVLAHHSTSDFWTDEGGDGRLQRQMAENWADVPIVVTTAEQFFESAYSSRPGASRKLHNIVNSVVIIDELQAIPLRLLTPCIAFLKALVHDFRCTVLIMTGTMPPLRHQALLGSDTNVTPIASPKSTSLRRVRIFKSRFNNCYFSTIAAFMRKREQALAIANTRSGALEIYRNLPISSRTYISTWLCPLHRSEIIEDIRTKLKSSSRCHVASTQVIEAGVDFDFPDLLLREKAPLDSMIQAFGRCNRNGGGRGHCYIFSPTIGNKLPEYDAGIAVVNELLYRRRLNPHNPKTMTLYYELLYLKKNLDVDDIMDQVGKLNFQSVRDEFRLIKDNQVNLVVSYGSMEQKTKLQEASEFIRKGIANDLPVHTYRWAVRCLQGYVVSLYPETFEKVNKAFPQAAKELFLNYFEWKGDYSETVGLGNVAAALNISQI
jgi:CRISPR-associated endonuclease/helicase Cas3